MRDFDELRTHVRCLADALDNREEPAWPLIVNQHWKAIAQMWREEPIIIGPSREVGFTLTAEQKELELRQIVQEIETGQREIKRHEQINIDARHAVIHQPEPKTRKAMCGNCGMRYEITDDPVENHHIAMRHKQVCGKEHAAYTEQQRDAFIGDFQNQPMQIEFRRRAAVALEAGADPEILKVTGVSIFSSDPQPAQIEASREPEPAAESAAPRRWWQFWRWL